MRLYKSSRFAVYQSATMFVVVYGCEGPPMKLHQYHQVEDDADQTMLLDILNTELSEDVDAFLAAFTTMEAPYNADSI